MIKRIKELQSKLDGLGIDAVYLASAVCHRYFTTLDNPDGHLLITKEKAYAFEDFRYTEVANNTLSGAYTVLEPRRDFTTQLNEIFASDGIKKLGYEIR
jgi:Xaa-Pro aminopeptidase